METVYKIDCLKGEERGQEASESPTVAGNWEKQWIESAKEGNTEAFERIVLAYQQRVYNLAYRLLSEREEAEDLTQEVFVNVFRHLSRFRGESQFSTWIYQITVNHCRNRLKYLRRRFHYATESVDDPLVTDQGEIGRDLADEGDIPEEALYRQQVQRLVQVALGKLREDYREVIALRDIQNLSYKDISETLEIPEGTIKSRLHRARWELKEILKDLGLTWGD